MFKGPNSHTFDFSKTNPIVAFISILIFCFLVNLNTSYPQFKKVNQLPKQRNNLMILKGYNISHNQNEFEINVSIDPIFSISSSNFFNGLRLIIEQGDAETTLKLKYCSISDTNKTFFHFKCFSPLYGPLNYSLQLYNRTLRNGSFNIENIVYYYPENSIYTKYSPTRARLSYFSVQRTLFTTTFVPETKINQNGLLFNHVIYNYGSTNKDFIENSDFKFDKITHIFFGSGTHNPYEFYVSVLNPLSYHLLLSSEYSTAVIVGQKNFVDLLYPHFSTTFINFNQSSSFYDGIIHYEHSTDFFPLRNHLNITRSETKFIPVLKERGQNIDDVEKLIKEEFGDQYDPLYIDDDEIDTSDIIGKKGFITLSNDACGYMPLLADNSKIVKLNGRQEWIEKMANDLHFKLVYRQVNINGNDVTII